MDADKFWRDLVSDMHPLPTSTNPGFAAGEFVKEYGPIPDWLPHQYDLMRDGWYFGFDTPEAKAKRTQAIRDALESAG